MISKKWRKLEKQLIDENEKNNDEEDEKEKNIKKEILIIDINNNIENENQLKTKLSKPKPILNVDLDSINLTNYEVNKKKNYPYNEYNIYYKDNNYSFNNQPRQYTYYYTSYFNSSNIKNSHINNLAKSNDYTYNYSLRNNYFEMPIKGNRTYVRTSGLEKFRTDKNNLNLISKGKNENYKNIKPFNFNLYNDMNNNSKYNNCLKNNNKGLSYSYSLQPYKLRPNSSIKNNNLYQNNFINNSSVERRINSSRNNNSTNDLFSRNSNNNTLKPIILIKNNRYKADNSIDSQLNYIYI